MNQVRINLQFGGALLPVAKNEAGQDMVPLKPISDEIGLDWENQRVRMHTPYFTRRFGICTHEVMGADQTRMMVCIRLDRVVAFLNSLNPNTIRAGGNEAAADYLERKHSEWDDLIHQYEAQNGQLIQQAASAKIINIRTFLAVSREMRMVESKNMRVALGAIAGGLALDAGVSYQPDLLDAPASK